MTARGLPPGAWNFRTKKGLASDGLIMIPTWATDLQPPPPTRALSQRPSVTSGRRWRHSQAQRAHGYTPSHRGRSSHPSTVMAAGFTRGPSRGSPPCARRLRRSKSEVQLGTRKIQGGHANGIPGGEWRRPPPAGVTPRKLSGVTVAPQILREEATVKSIGGCGTPGPGQEHKNSVACRSPALLRFVLVCS